MVAVVQAVAVVVRIGLADDCHKAHVDIDLQVVPGEEAAVDHTVAAAVHMEVVVQVAVEGVHFAAEVAFFAQVEVP